MVSSPYGRPVILVFGYITFIPKFEGDQPERWRSMRVGWVRFGDFRPLSRRISETVQGTTKVTIDPQWEIEYALSIGTKIDDLDTWLTLK